MPEEQFTIEVLPSGEQVKTYKDGRKYLIRTPSPLVERLSSAEETHAVASSELQQKLVDAIDTKLAEMDAGDPVPPEKRSL